MLTIQCPYCGPRAHTEFRYGGDATRARPRDDGEGALAEWIEYVYLRDNPRGPHAEYWQHVSGCRSWLTVERNTESHGITAVRPAGGERS
jgi:heterotetrameric sarcosine oxidase delta subunit